MVVIKVWKCDSCGKLIERRSEVYVLNLKSLPFKVVGDPAAEYETNEIELHFCYNCAKNIAETIKKLEATLRGRIGTVSA